MSDDTAHQVTVTVETLSNSDLAINSSVNQKAQITITNPAMTGDQVAEMVNQIIARMSPGIEPTSVQDPLPDAPYLVN